MENQRLFLTMGLAFVVMLIWQTWMEDYGEKAPAPTVAIESGQSATSPVSNGDVPKGVAAAASSVEAVPGAPEVKKLQSARRIRVVTDLFDMEIDTKGGDLRRADLLTYPVAIDQPDNPFRIMDDGVSRTYIAQTGLLEGEGNAPTHHAIFIAKQDSYEMKDGETHLDVELVWQGNGVVVTKTYRFTRGSHSIDVLYSIANNTGSTWNGKQYRQFQRGRPPADSQSKLIVTYTGGAIYSPAEKYEKIAFDDIDDGDLSREITGGWAAMLEHYFVSAWVPAESEANLYYSKSLGNGLYSLGLMSPRISVQPGQVGEMATVLYVGPKVKNELDDVSEGLYLTIDYGWLTVISEPLFWLLDAIHGIVGNWGWSIVLLTVLIKLAFYRLSKASYISMANMRKLTPKLKALKERHADDKQKLNQAMMDLYKKEKINPLGGCLPIMVQIPVFIALYWALLESVELRQAPWIFWIQDLSQLDPYYVLPVIMGISMVIQQRLNPAPMDPMQAKVMMALPLLFTVFFAFFPSGLVIYWVVNNLLSIAQQWHITKRIEAGETVT